MLRILSGWWARLSYVWREESQAHFHTLNAKASLRNAKLTRVIADRTAKEVDDIEKRIAEVAAMEEEGFWLCECGFESPLSTAFGGVELEISRDCLVCEDNKPMKLVKRATMSGKDKYESDKERKEAESIVASKRAEVAGHEEAIKNAELTAKTFMRQANQSREFADILRNL